jgi:hypothetical protein
VTEVLIRGAQANFGRLFKPFYLTAILCACALPFQPGAAQMREIKQASAGFDLEKDHIAIPSLDGLWQFRFGDESSPETFAR